MPEPHPSRRNFPKAARLLRGAEFDAVFSQKLSAADGWLLVYGAHNQAGHSRLGLVVSRKVGGAVRRNRWKRLLREAFRLSRSEMPPLDLVCLPRRPSPPELADLVRSLDQLSRRVAKKAARRAEGEGGAPA